MRSAISATSAIQRMHTLTGRVLDHTMDKIAASLTNFLAVYGVLAIFVVMFLKEFGLPIPVPSDMIMISAGVQAASGLYPLGPLVLAIAGAVFLGGSVQFLITRGAGRRLVYRLGRFVGLTPERLDRAMAAHDPS